MNEETKSNSKRIVKLPIFQALGDMFTFTLPPQLRRPETKQPDEWHYWQPKPRLHPLYEALSDSLTTTISNCSSPPPEQPEKIAQLFSRFVLNFPNPGIYSTSQGLLLLTEAELRGVIKTIAIARQWDIATEDFLISLLEECRLALAQVSLRHYLSTAISKRSWPAKNLREILRLLHIVTTPQDFPEIRHLFGLSATKPSLQNAFLSKSSAKKVSISSKLLNTVEKNLKDKSPKLLSLTDPDFHKDITSAANPFAYLHTQVLANREFIFQMPNYLYLALPSHWWFLSRYLEKITVWKNSAKRRRNREESDYTTAENLLFKVLLHQQALFGETSDEVRSTKDDLQEVLEAQGKQPSLSTLQVHQAEIEENSRIEIYRYLRPDTAPLAYGIQFTKRIDLSPTGEPDFLPEEYPDSIELAQQDDYVKARRGFHWSSKGIYKNKLADVSKDTIIPFWQAPEFKLKTIKPVNEDEREIFPLTDELPDVLRSLPDDQLKQFQDNVSKQDWHLIQEATKLAKRSKLSKEQKKRFGELNKKLVKKTLASIRQPNISLPQEKEEEKQNKSFWWQLVYSSMFSFLEDVLLPQDICAIFSFLSDDGNLLHELKHSKRPGDKMFNRMMWLTFFDSAFHTGRSWEDLTALKIRDVLQNKGKCQFSSRTKDQLLVPPRPLAPEGQAAYYKTSDKDLIPLLHTHPDLLGIYLDLRCPGWRNSLAPLTDKEKDKPLFVVKSSKERVLTENDIERKVEEINRNGTLSFPLKDFKKVFQVYYTIIGSLDPVFGSHIAGREFPWLHDPIIYTLVRFSHLRKEYYKARKKVVKFLKDTVASPQHHKGIFPIPVHREIQGEDDLFLGCPTVIRDEHITTTFSVFKQALHKNEQAVRDTIKNNNTIGEDNFFSNPRVIEYFNDINEFGFIVTCLHAFRSGAAVEKMEIPNIDIIARWVTVAGKSNWKYLEARTCPMSQEYWKLTTHILWLKNTFGLQSFPSCFLQIKETLEGWEVKPLTAEKVRDKIKKICLQKDIPYPYGDPLHTLRDYYRSFLFAEGIPIAAINAVMGHKSVGREWESVHSAHTFNELKRFVDPANGKLAKRFHLTEAIWLNCPAQPEEVVNLYKSSFSSSTRLPAELNQLVNNVDSKLTRAFLRNIWEKGLRDGLLFFSPTYRWRFIPPTSLHLLPPQVIHATEENAHNKNVLDELLTVLYKNGYIAEPPKKRHFKLLPTSPAILQLAEDEVNNYGQKAQSFYNLSHSLLNDYIDKEQKTLIPKQGQILLQFIGLLTARFYEAEKQQQNSSSPLDKHKSEFFSWLNEQEKRNEREIQEEKSISFFQLAFDELITLVPRGSLLLYQTTVNNFLTYLHNEELIPSKISITPYLKRARHLTFDLAVLQRIPLGLFLQLLAKLEKEQQQLLKIPTLSKTQKKNLAYISLCLLQAHTAIPFRHLTDLQEEQIRIGDERITLLIGPPRKRKPVTMSKTGSTFLLPWLHFWKMGSSGSNRKILGILRLEKDPTEKINRWLQKTTREDNLPSMTCTEVQALSCRFQLENLPSFLVAITNGRIDYKPELSEVEFLKKPPQTPSWSRRYKFQSNSKKKLAQKIYEACDSPKWKKTLAEYARDLPAPKKDKKKVGQEFEQKVKNIVRFMLSKKTRLRELSRKKYARDLRDFLKWFETKPVTAQEIEQFLKVSKVSPSIIGQFFKDYYPDVWAQINWRQIASLRSQPPTRVAPLKSKKKLFELIPEDTSEEIAKKSALYLGSHGLREKPVWHMRLNDLIVPKSRKAMGFIKVRVTKRASSRVVLLYPETTSSKERKVLRKHCDNVRLIYWGKDFNPYLFKEIDGHSFPNPGALANFCVRNTPLSHFHLGRHGYAKELLFLTAGPEGPLLPPYNSFPDFHPLAFISRSLGHAVFITTEREYLHGYNELREKWLDHWKK